MAAMTEAEMEAVVMSFPMTEKGMSYGQPSFKVNGKFFTRLRREDASLVLLEVSFDEREMLIAAEPATFHFTAHYKDYPSVLARIDTLHPGSLRNFLERRWKKIAPKRHAPFWWMPVLATSCVTGRLDGRVRRHFRNSRCLSSRPFSRHPAERQRTPGRHGCDASRFAGGR